MHRTAATAAAPLLAALVLATPLAPAPARAQDAGPGARPDRWVPAVAVYRGGESNVPPAVPVLRGSPAAAAGAVPPPAPAAPAAGDVAAVGGDRFWRYDAAAGELVACRLGPTTQVGRDRIRCTRGSLPPPPP